LTDKFMTELFERDEESIMLIDSSRQYNYSTVKNDMNGLYSRINKRVIALFLCSNTYESIMGYLSCLMNRVVPILVSENISEIYLENILENYKPEFIWMPMKFNVSGDINSIVTEYTGKYVFENYILLKRNKIEKYKIHDDLALLLTTSGTTGSLKLVRISYENIKENTRQIINSLNMNSSNIGITILPMNYTYGLSVINTHLFVGGKIVIADKGIYRKEFWDLVTKYKCDSLYGVPYIYEMIIKFGYMKKMPDCVKYLTQAGGYLRQAYKKKIVEFCKDNNIEFYVMYGQTEATARISCMNLTKNTDKIESIGKALDNIECCFNNDGEMIIKGKNVSLGYAYDYTDLKKGNDNMGVLNTGDVISVDSEGYLYWKGRNDSYGKILGKRINLNDINRKIERDCGICDFVSFINNDKLLIYIEKDIFKGQRDLDEDVSKKINRIMHENTELTDKMYNIRFIDKIPRLENGKVDYKGLKL